MPELTLSNIKDNWRKIAKFQNGTFEEKSRRWLLILKMNSKYTGLTN